MKKLISVLLCLCMLCSFLPAGAFAAYEDGLCPHHTYHDYSVCGYVEAVPGRDCTFSHENCGCIPAAPATEPCNHVCSVENGCIVPVHSCIHTEHIDCGYSKELAIPCTCPYDEDGSINCTGECGTSYVPGNPCGHVCGDGCYRLSQVCIHVHGQDGCSHVAQPAVYCGHVCSADVCGFVAPVEGQSCGFVCEICAGDGSAENAGGARLGSSGGAALYNEADSVSIELSGYSFEYTGSAIEPEVTSVKVSGVAVAEGTDYTVSYANNVEVGEATVVITGIGRFAGETRRVSFTITPKTEPEAPVDNVTIELSGYSFEYTGSAIEPEVTSVKVGGVAVVEGTDYTVSYANNVEVGEATVVITGIGRFAGETRSVSFTITPKTETEPPADPVDPVTVTLSGDSFEYTGSEIKPTVSVLNGTNTLTEGVHFEVEYSDNINAGEATVTVRGLGDAYSGHVRTAKFEITKRAVTVIAADQTITKGEDIEGGAFSVTNLVEGHVPTASLLPSTTDVTDNGTITPTAISISAAGVDVTANYAITPVAGKLIINPAAPGELVDGNLRISLEKYSYSYTGSEIKPKVTVVLDGKTLAEGKDYDVFYTDNVNVGKATVTLVGKGDFENESRRLNFNITPRVITPQIALSGYSFVFNNRAHRPAVTVYDGNRALSSSEYIVGYKDNVNIGIATVTVRDAEGGNYVLKETGASFRIVGHIPYRIIYGNGSGWIRNASYCLTFACNGDYANFRGIFVDGMRVDPAYYSSSSGSTVVTLYPNLLRLLGNGWHYLTFEYVDGYATAVFYVGPPSINAPVTGDDSSLGLLSAVMALGIMGSVSALVLLRRKKNRS